jgi:hypothetical protein
VYTPSSHLSVIMVGTELISECTYEATFGDQAYMATKLCSFSIFSATSRQEWLIAKDRMTSFLLSHSAAGGLLVGRGILVGE